MNQKSILKIIGVALCVIGIKILVNLNLIPLLLKLIISISLATYSIYKLVFFFIKLSKIIQLYYQNKPADFYEFLENNIQSFFNKPFSTILLQELSFVFYFFKFKAKTPSKNEFIYQNDGNLKVIYYAIIIVAFIETSCLHLLLAKYELNKIAYVLLFLNAYTLFMLIAHLNATSQRLITILETSIKIKNGLFCNFIIPKSEILEIVKYEKDIPQNEENFKVGLIKNLESHNIKIICSNTISIKLFYGIQKSAKTIYLQVDDSNKFIEFLKEPNNKFKVA